MLKITDVNINSSYNWGNNIKQMKDWNTIRLCNSDWNSVKMTATIGMQVNIEVTVVENTWELLKESYIAWQSINELQTWAIVKNI